MKNNKGITLISLVVYIAVVFVVLAILMRVTTYFSANIKDIADVSFEEEFNKLNLYLLDEAKKSGNAIAQISTDSYEVTFYKGNKYSYNVEDKKIYLNDSIKICENIENCLFEQRVADNGKEVLVLTITINGTTKTVEYVLVTKSEETTLLPVQYQQVEYIENTGTQYIDTGFIPNSNTSIEMKASNAATSTTCLYCARGTNGYQDNTYTAFLINGTSLRIDYSETQNENIMTAESGIEYIYKQNKNLVYINEELITTLTESEFSSAYNMYLMASHRGETGIESIGNIKLYYCKIWDGETLVRDFVPCYRKSDNVVGLYDTVNDIFYTNAGTGEFIAGANDN